MTKRMLIILLVAVVAVAAVPAFAQDNTGTVKGKAVDEKSQPMPGVTIVLQSPDGKKITFKSDKGGEFEKTGVPVGTYKVQMLIESQPRWGAEGLNVTSGHTTPLIIDLAAEAARASMSAEQKKQLEEQQKKNEQQRSNIKNLNAKINEAKNLQTQGNYDQAIAMFQEMAQANPGFDVLWYDLGDAYLTKASKTTDRAQATEEAGKAADALQKAAAIKPTVAGYHNNLGNAFARAGKFEDAIKEYTQAAQLDPTGAAQSYFNAGAVLTNEAMKAPASSDDQHKKLHDANEMFEKSLTADPKYRNGEAYYQMGTNLLNQATLAKDGKMELQPGTKEAFQKYLDTAPTGPYAEQVKQTMAALGSQVETTYKKTGGKKK